LVVKFDRFRKIIGSQTNMTKHFYSHSIVAGGLLEIS